MILYAFLSGAAAFGFLVCGLFFLRYWDRSRDLLFLSFALAFGLLGVGQAILALTDWPTEERGLLYLFRLSAFLLILGAIYRKNKSPQ